MKFQRFNTHFFLVLGADAVLVWLSLYTANLIRFDFNIPQVFLNPVLRIFPIVLLIKLCVFFMFGSYRGMWRYTSISDLMNIIKASTTASLLTISWILFQHSFVGYSRSVFVLDWFFTIFLIAGFRLTIRFYYQNTIEMQSFSEAVSEFIGRMPKEDRVKKRLLIIGAGDCGEKILREIRDNSQLGYQVVGFLDDQPEKKGRTIHGVPVIDGISEIELAAEKLSADEALIAIPSANSVQMRRIVDYCKNSGLKFRTVPGYGELINGKVTANAIREVAYRDLLGRDIVRLETSKIGAYLQDQCVMVTGAGGSIGSELCRQICRFRPRRILLFERAESPLYDIELELKKIFANIVVTPILADILDLHQLEKVFRQFDPKIVFHAAAYKHVPMLEDQPWRAVENNIHGTGQLVRTAIRFGIEHFVLVSTDKAVRPTNVMGATKRVAEMIVQQSNDQNTGANRLMIVRFGNVIGSAGSVIPLFKKQIQEGGPVTVTHPEVTRYFMMIPEACQLILQAGALTNTMEGDVYILDMGTPIKIVDMAKDLIRFSGFEPDKDIKIEYIGLRPGEKLYEELMTQDEGVVPTSHEKIMVVKQHGAPITDLDKKIDGLIKAARNQDRMEIVRLLQDIVPEYHPDVEPLIDNNQSKRIHAL